MLLLVAALLFGPGWCLALGSSRTGFGFAAALLVVGLVPLLLLTALGVLFTLAPLTL